MTRQLVLSLFGLALVLRLILIAYGLWQDANKDKFGGVRYTDVDYLVYSDAANYVLGRYARTENSEDIFAAGNALSYAARSPYNRATYRYTPLLAISLTPNAWHPAFGKLLFASCDLIVGYLLIDTIKKVSKESRQTSNHRASLFLVAIAWLFNPIVMNISTRGSSESLIALFVLSSLNAVINDSPMLAGMAWATSIHFKIYPIIYALPFIIYLSPQPRDTTRKGIASSLTRLARSVLNRKAIAFAFMAFSTAIFLTAIMLVPFGPAFLEHTYLYHLGRLDHRHNFSPYFYPIYLALHQKENAQTFSLCVNHAFIFQLSLCLSLSLLALQRSSHRSQVLINTVFLTTMAFVTFNKVVTAQYFMWIISLLPLVLAPRLRDTRFRLSWQPGPRAPSHGLGRRHVFLLVLWFASQALWLGSAFELEHLALAGAFHKVWQKSLIWLVANVVILVACILDFGVVQ